MHKEDIFFFKVIIVGITMLFPLLLKQSFILIIWLIKLSLSKIY